MPKHSAWLDSYRDDVRTPRRRHKRGYDGSRHRRPRYPGSVSSWENPLKNACRNTGAWPGKAKISFTILFCHLVDNYAHVTIFFVQYWALALRIYSRYIFFMTLNVCICCLWRSLENKLLLSVEKSTMQTHNFQNQSSARFLENYPVGARFLEPQNNSTAPEPKLS